MAEEELRDRVALLCQDLYRAMDDNTAFTTLEEQWNHLLDLVADATIAHQPSPLIMKLLRAKIHPRLLYIIANYTPPKIEGPDDVSFRAMIWYGSLRIHTFIIHYLDNQELFIGSSAMEKRIQYREVGAHKLQVMTQVLKSSVFTNNELDIDFSILYFVSRSDLVLSCLRLLTYVCESLMSMDMPHSDPCITCENLEFWVAFLPLLLPAWDVIRDVDSELRNSGIEYCSSRYILMLEQGVLRSYHICQDGSSPIPRPPKEFEVVFGTSPSRFLPKLRALAGTGSRAEARSMAMLTTIAQGFPASSTVDAYVQHNVLQDSVATLNSMFPGQELDLQLEAARSVVCLWEALARSALSLDIPSFGRQIVDTKLVLTLEVITHATPDETIIRFTDRSVCFTFGLLKNDIARTTTFRSQLQVIARRAATVQEVAPDVRWLWRAAASHRCSICCSEPMLFPTLSGLDHVCSRPGCEFLERADLLCGKCRAPYCSKDCQRRHWKTHKPHCQKHESR